VSTVARFGGRRGDPASSSREREALLRAEPDVRLANKGKQDAGTTLDAPGRIHNLKHAPLDRCRLVT